MQSSKKTFSTLLFVILSFSLYLGSNCVKAQEVESSYRNEKITIDRDRIGLSKALDIIAQKANVKFFYNHSHLNTSRLISCSYKNIELDKILSKILEEENVEITYTPDRVVVIKNKARQDKNDMEIRGRIYDKENKEALVGATVQVKEIPTKGAITKSNGNFVLNLPEGEFTLIITYIGYTQREIIVNKNSKFLNISLAQNKYEMDDVVVTGMAPRKVESFTGTYVSVKAEELKKLNPNNLLEALQFFDPSFRVLENNREGSNPNALPTFRMRGDIQLGDISANQMEMMMGDYSRLPNMPLFILDGFEASLQNIIDIDPERIESITILKDAAATAIYGSKAANGVIIFETKKSLDGDINISYSSNFGISIPDLSDYNLMNAEEKLEFEKRVGIFNPNSAEDMNYYNHYKREIMQGVNTYWISQPLRTAVTHRHNLTMSGGNKTLGYNLSMNYNQTPGVMKGSNRNSMGLSFNLQYRKDKWNISNSISLQNTKGDNSPYGSFGRYTRLNPYYRLKDESGEYTSIIERKFIQPGTQRTTIINPLYNVKFPSKDFNENFNITDNLFIEYSPINNLRLNLDASFTKSNSRNERFISKNNFDYFYSETDLTKKGSYNKSTGEGFSWTVNASANYNLVIYKHNISSFFRISANENNSYGINLDAKGFPNDIMTDFLFAFEMNDRVRGSETTSRSLGLVGQISYMYDFKYAIDFSVRGDISSQFGSNTGMAPFWALGVRYNAHREKFLENTIISDLVFTASYGINGSQNYSPYQAIETYSFNNLLLPYESSDVLGAELLGFGNSNLGWSKTTNKSFGFNIGLWNNKVSLSFSGYNNYTDQLLIDYSLAPSTGFNSIMQNAGAVVNKGYDISLSVLLLRDYEKGLSWSMSINGFHNRNIIKKISNFLANMNKRALESRDAPPPIFREGESTTQIFAVRSLGIDPATGREVFLSKDNRPTFVWSPGDKVSLGDTQPKISGSIMSSVTWRNLSLSIASSYQYGSYQYNSTIVDKIENIDIALNQDRRAAQDRWSPNNRKAKFKSMTRLSHRTPASSRFVQKLNEFRLSSISASYRLESQKHKFLKKLDISSVSLSFNMSDIARFSTIKEERGLDYPFARSFNLSMSVLF